MNSSILPILLLTCCCGGGGIDNAQDCACIAAMLLCMGALATGCLCSGLSAPTV